MTTAHVIRIDPDGVCTVVPFGDVERTAFTVADDEFDGQSTVVTLTSPHIDRHTTLVGWVHDTARYLMYPLNIKGWALYGRSPVVGTMFIANDRVLGDKRLPLPPDLVDKLLGDGDWVGATTRRAMRMMIEQHGKGEAGFLGPVPAVQWNGGDDD